MTIARNTPNKLTSATLRRLCFLTAAAAWLANAGCDSNGAIGSDAYVAGTYTVSVSWGKNGCTSLKETDSWKEGSPPASNIPLDIMQADASNMISGKVGGIPAIFVGLLHGTTDYSGTVKGSVVDLNIYGKLARSLGACSYTWNGNVHGELNGDSLAGTIRYFPAGNGSPECPRCTAEQLFNGTRPPGSGTPPNKRVP